ncbi:conserved hypothetical protein [Paecilomyces variotii No. 5]|uniref:Uncharacterized protein n=1 Tax=Byssochlamys spectabilis (strain No. 5 / NBRC 109023) TaxID=1356009 RepID=V5FIM4_BYSSN|nr:conserved hypothetical protein [Paecilomyces variotii No. 5]
MHCYHCAKSFIDRDEFESHRQSHIERQQQLHAGVAGNGLGSSIRARKRRHGVLRAPEVLLSLAGKTLKSSDETPSAVDSFQDALRCFPPYTEKGDGGHQMTECFCPDCDAIFSSSYVPEKPLRSGYSDTIAESNYNSIILQNIALAAQYSLIKKGYRVEKKSIPLDAQPFRVACEKCGEQYFNENDRDAHQNMHETQDLECLHCGLRYDTSYELDAHYDWHDDMEYRQQRHGSEDSTSSDHSRSPSLASSGRSGPLAPQAPIPTIETAVAKKSSSSILRGPQKLRESWPLRKTPQKEDDELVAISFSSAEDLERIYAPDGILQEGCDSSLPLSPTSQLMTITETSAISHYPTAGSDAEKTAVTTLCEESFLQPSEVGDYQDDVSSDSGATGDNASKKDSLFRSVLGKKISRSLSYSSTTSAGKKLIKKGAIRFSIVSNRLKNDNDSIKSGTTSSERSESRNGRDSPALKVRVADISDSDSGYGGSPKGAPGPFIHIRPLSEGSFANDASGRQRILSMEQIAFLYLQISECISCTPLKTKATTVQSRAEAELKRGNLEDAAAEYLDMLNIYNENPALDIDRMSRAGILHELGRIYEALNQPSESEWCFLEALGLYKRTFGRDYARNFCILNDIAALCEKDGYATEAAELYDRSLAGRLKTLGQNAPETLGSMQDLATIKTSLGDIETAVLLFEMVVPALETVFGLQHENTLTAMDNLSMLYQRLGLNEESRDISRRMIPSCRSVFGIDSSMTRDAIAKYLKNSTNFDFSPDVKEILDHYRRSRQPQSLRVLQGLGRAYMDASLNRDAVDLFQTLFDAFTSVKGSDAPETLDALSALCVSREHLDALEQAIQAYGQLIQIARKAPPDHHSRRRMDYAQKRVTDLRHRQDVLSAERKAWGLNAEGPCGKCQSPTKSLCNGCHIVRYCSENCQKQNMSTHQARCIPSITLRESKSIAVKPKCPSLIQDTALAKIASKTNNTSPANITASYTFYLDQRNFTTFRMKLSSAVNTIVLFSSDVSIQYMMLDSTGPSSESTSASEENISPVEWTTPHVQEYVSISPPSRSLSTYLVVAPGKDMLREHVDRRINARSGGGEREKFEALTLPDNDLIEYCQGTLLNGYMGEAFMYVLEWI